MKYTVTIDVPEKEVVKQAHFLVPEPIYRDFAYVSKSKGRPMNRIIVDFMRDFVAEFRRTRAKQEEMF